MIVGFAYLEGGSGEEGHAAVLHLAADQSDGDGRPRHHADADLVVQLGHVQLRLVAAEHVVLGLLDDGRHAVELPAVGVRLHHLDGRPPGRAPVHHPALIDHVVYSSHHLCKCNQAVIYSFYLLLSGQFLCLTVKFFPY
jgi:hypothetical protein